MNRAKKQAKTQTIHHESLLNLVPVKMMIDDTSKKLSARAIDQAWYNERIIPISVSGFNPFTGSLYYARNSDAATWLESPQKSARSLNFEDRLMREALFLTHDYLHSWAVSTIRALSKHTSGYGVEPITNKNFEDYVFCHLLTEAVATVGLDYWYLCQTDVNTVCPVGTLMDGLTVSYNFKYDEEYRKFNPELTVNSPDFFGFIAEFYCSGEFSGFSAKDLKHSPRLYSWLKHEISYGEVQRKYARLWFSNLHEQNKRLEGAELIRPISINKPWQKKLVKDLGNALWTKIKQGDRTFSIKNVNTEALWQASRSKICDPRFINIKHYDLNELVRSLGKETNAKERFKFFCFQYFSGYVFKSVDPEVIKIIPYLIERMDFGLIHGLFKGFEKVKKSAKEPHNLFILS